MRMSQIAALRHVHACLRNVVLYVLLQLQYCAAAEPCNLRSAPQASNTTIIGAETTERTALF